jgi:hypothetical protein
MQERSLIRCCQKYPKCPDPGHRTVGGKTDSGGIESVI